MVGGRYKVTHSFGSYEAERNMGHIGLALQSVFWDLYYDINRIEKRFIAIITEVSFF